MLATVRDARASMFLITLSYGAPKHLEAPRRRPTALKARAAPISFFPFLGHTPKKKPTFPNQPHGIRHYKMERKQRSSLVWSGNARRAAKHEYFLVSRILLPTRVPAFATLLKAAIGAAKAKATTRLSIQRSASRGPWGMRRITGWFPVVSRKLLSDVYSSAYALVYDSVYHKPV